MSADTEKYHDQIDAYLRGELSQEEQDLFEEQLKLNKELKQEYLIHVELYAQEDERIWASEELQPDTDEVAKLESYFKSEEAQEFKRILASANENYKQQKNEGKNTKWLLPLVAAASIAIIMMLQFDFFKPSTVELYAEYSNWNDLPSLTSRGDENQLAQGQLYFEEGKYTESLNVFVEYLENENELSSSILTYMGLASLELDKENDALVYFNQLINSDAIDQSRGYWYKALLFLKQEKISQTKETLKIIVSDSTNYNFEKAKELLDDLN